MRAGGLAARREPIEATAILMHKIGRWQTPDGPRTSIRYLGGQLAAACDLFFFRCVSYFRVLFRQLGYGIVALVHV